MASTQLAATAPEPGWRWYQFSLRTLLLSAIPVALFSGWLSSFPEPWEPVCLQLTKEGTVIFQGKTLKMKELQQVLGRHARSLTSDDDTIELMAAIAAAEDATYIDMEALMRICRKSKVRWAHVLCGNEGVVWHLPPDSRQEYEGLPDELALPLIVVHLTADSAGALHSILVNERTVVDCTELNQLMVDIAGDECGIGSIRRLAEVRMYCSKGLKLKHLIKAHNAILTGIDENGWRILLIRNILYGTQGPLCRKVVFESAQRQLHFFHHPVGSREREELNWDWVQPAPNDAAVLPPKRGHR